MLCLVDTTAERCSVEAIITSALLRRTVAGSTLVKSLAKRIPQDDNDLSDTIDRVCDGICSAEKHLLESQWNPGDPGLDPAVRSFVATAELRGSWQNMRREAMRAGGVASHDLDQFWQTHLAAETMVFTLRNAMADTFQLLLTVLWLYTREAWLRHVLDSLAATLGTSGAPHAGVAGSGDTEGTTGATPLSTAPNLPSAFRPVAFMIDALAPFAQLVQSALNWFEEAGIRHSKATYRPLSLPMLGMERLVARYTAMGGAAGGGDGKNDARGTEGTSSDPKHTAVAVNSGVWISLGAGTFWCSMSSRAEAVRRMSRTRCNVFLVIRPDEHGACFPKHMSLRGNGMDDTLFPLDTLFRITRITRAVSSDIDPTTCSRGPNMRWPVMIIELAAANRNTEVLELLDQRGELGSGELEAHLQEWANEAPLNEEHERLLAAGRLLSRCLPKHDGGAAGSGAHAGGDAQSRKKSAVSFLTQAVAVAEGCGDAECVAHALLALAQCQGGRDAKRDGRKALDLLDQTLGRNHPDSCEAREAWKALGVTL